MDQSNVVEFKNPAGIEDPVTEVLRQGARKLLAQAIEAEVEAFLHEHSGLTVSDGRRRVVRNGYPLGKLLIYELLERIQLALFAATRPLALGSSTSMQRPAHRLRMHSQIQCDVLLVDSLRYLCLDIHPVLLPGACDPTSHSRL